MIRENSTMNLKLFSSRFPRSHSRYQNMKSNATNTKILEVQTSKFRILSKISIEKLKQYGLSSQKSFYIKNLATLINNNELDLKSLRKLESKDITNMLIKIKMH